MTLEQIKDFLTYAKDLGATTVELKAEGDNIHVAVSLDSHIEYRQSAESIPDPEVAKKLIEAQAKKRKEWKNTMRTWSSGGGKVQ